MKENATGLGIRREGSIVDRNVLTIARLRKVVTAFRRQYGGLGSALARLFDSLTPLGFEEIVGGSKHDSGR